MDFHILGPLEVLHEGRAVALGGNRQRALLALLLLHANETLSTDRVIDELWGERPPGTAPRALHVQVSRLRKALAGSDGTGPIETRDHGYALVIDLGRLDAHRFEELLARGGAGAGRGPGGARGRRPRARARPVAWPAARRPRL